MEYLKYGTATASYAATLHVGLSSSLTVHQISKLKSSGRRSATVMSTSSSLVTQVQGAGTSIKKGSAWISARNSERGSSIIHTTVCLKLVVNSRENSCCATNFRV